MTVDQRKRANVGSGENLTPADLRESLPPEVWKAVKTVYDQGWTIRKQGHGVRLYCPCGARDGAISVAGTPPKPGNTARRILRAAQHCPDGHPSVN